MCAIKSAPYANGQRLAATFNRFVCHRDKLRQLQWRTNAPDPSALAIMRYGSARGLIEMRNRQLVLSAALDCARLDRFSFGTSTNLLVERVQSAQL